MRAFIVALISAAAIAFIVGLRFHPQALTSAKREGIWTFRRQDALAPFLYDYLADKFKLAPQKKLPGPGIKLRPRTAAPPPAPARNPAAMIQHALSNQGIWEQSQKLKQDMDAIPRNPFVEAAQKKKEYNS